MDYRDNRAPPRRSQQGSWDRRLDALERGQVELRETLSDLEKAVISVNATLKFIEAEAREQKIFRNRVYWAGGSAVALLIIQSLGLNVT